MLFGYVVCCLLGLLCIVGLSCVFGLIGCLLGSLGVFGSCCLFVVLLFGWVWLVWLRYFADGLAGSVVLFTGRCFVGFWVFGLRVGDGCLCVIVCCLLLVLMLFV